MPPSFDASMPPFSGMKADERMSHHWSCSHWYSSFPFAFTRALAFRQPFPLRVLLLLLRLLILLLCWLPAGARRHDPAPWAGAYVLSARGVQLARLPLLVPVPGGPSLEEAVSRGYGRGRRGVPLCQSRTLHFHRVPSLLSHVPALVHVSSSVGWSKEASAIVLLS